MGGTIIVEDGHAHIVPSWVGLRFPGIVEQAVQGYPMLIYEGQIAVNTANDEYARRTLVAEDTNGNILFAVTSSGAMRLTDLAEYLYDSDLDIVHAFNLDGGVSTSMYVSVDEQAYLVPAQTDIPAIIAGYG